MKLHALLTTDPIARRAAVALCACGVLALTIYACSDDSPSTPDPGDPPAQRGAVWLSDPPRGGMMTAGTMDSSQVDVSGVACDSAAAITGVRLNGTAASLTGAAPCRDFTGQVTSRWGLNMVRGTVTNEWNQKTHLVQSYLRSPDYFAPAVSTASAAVEMVPGGVTIQLNQEFIDDGVRPGGIAEMDDLASAFHLIVNDIDLDAAIPIQLIPVPAARSCNCVWPIPDIDIHDFGYSVRRGTLDYTALSVDAITLVQNGIHVSISTGAMSLPLTVKGYQGSCILSCVDRIDDITISGVVYVNSLSIDVTSDVILGSGGRPEIGNPVVQVSMPGLRLDIDWGLLEFLDSVFGLSNITSGLVNQFYGGMTNLIETKIEDELPVLVNGFIESFEPPATVTLPAPMNITLNFESKFDEVSFNASRARLGVAVGVTPANPVIGAGTGPIQRGGSAPSFPTSPNAFGAGFKDDLLNQFLWAAWSGGALEIDDVSLLGCDVPEGFKLSMSALLPPVVMPGTGNNQIDIGLGDVYIEATPLAPTTMSAGGLSTGSVALYAAGVSGATFSIDPATGRFSVALENSDIGVQIVYAPNGTSRTALASEYADVFDCILTEVLARIVGSYPIPAVPVGLLDIPGIPPATRMSLEDGVVGRQDPYYTLIGDVKTE